MIRKYIILFLFFPVTLSLKGQIQLGTEVSEGISFFMPSKFANGVKPLFKFGGFLRYPIHNLLFIESGIYCGINSADIRHFSLYDETLEKMEAEWLCWDIPLLFGHTFRLDKKDNFSLSISAGLYFMYQYGGNATFTFKDGQVIEQDNLFEDKRIDINSVPYFFEKKRRMDIGGRLKIDCNYKKWVVRITTSFGFTSYRANYIEEMRQNSLSLGLGYFLRM